MKLSILSLRLPVVILVFLFAQAAFAQRVITSFDNDWRFSLGDQTGAGQQAFNDQGWRSLNVPHDWSIEGNFDRNNATGRGGGYLPGGIGWYRKTFSLSAADEKKLFFIEFDGVMANSDVWINGYHLGKRPNGYISFQYELTDHLNFGENKTNTIAVRADNSIQPASRWYTGAGIYRHVRLVSTAPVHISHLGTFISCSGFTKEEVTVQVQTAIINQSSAAAKVKVQTNLYDPSGILVGTAASSHNIGIGLNQPVILQIKIKQPRRWNIDNPALYKAVTAVQVSKTASDEVTNTFGIREIKFDAATGFWLNDQNIKMKGVCLHHDGGAVGSAVPLRVWQKRLESLKEVGVNAIRTSHNAVSPEFLTLCDQMGFMVMDETFDTWMAKKSSAENGYNLYFKDWWEQDTRDIVMRDRNHPCIMIYSVGNEIHDNLNDSTGLQKYLMQQNLVHSLDSTRPVTMALFRPALSHVYDNGFANRMDVVGQNYRENELIAAHNKNPARKVIGTENRHEQAAWIAMRDNAFIAGQFLWTGYDYIGEADWPKNVFGGGLFDKTGGARDIAFQRKSWWSDQPVVHVMRKEGNAGAGEWISDWSPTDIDTYDEAQVQVFSNCDEVELFLNDQSVGIRKRPADNASPRTWTITFHKGTLKAVGRNNGKEAAREVLATAGQPSKIILTVDKAEVENKWDDLVYVTATITDDNGNPCLNADNKITFNAQGAGMVTAVDNADLASAEPFVAKERWAYKGRVVALVKANASVGTIMIDAGAAGLKADMIKVTVKN